MDNSEPASPPAPHAPNHDSMVTVSLSDIQSNSEHTQLDWRTLDIPPTPVESSHESEANQNGTQSFGPRALRDAAKTTPVSLDKPLTLTTTEDTTVDGDSENEVDWENLEKTEEQEPRGEGSDDVSHSWQLCGRDIDSHLGSLRHFFWLDWNRRIMHWQPIRNPAYQTPLEIRNINASPVQSHSSRLNG